MEKQVKKEKISIILLAASIGVVMIAIAVGMLLYRTTRPTRQAKREAIAIAEEYADLETVENFYWFNGHKTYFSVSGETGAGEDIIVVIAQDGQEIEVVSQQDGLNEPAIRAIVREDYNDPMIKKIGIGFYEDQVIWEVVGQDEQSEELTYYLFSFETGKEVKVVANI
ncbi:uncharacterized protein YpmB [Enterococcus sp. PF1-24]|uniref:cell wall elongation regulator TseB-like domain-containing protein n=1 Tax=unclassified Enterococcus TaxID=2608891 RepID=UPI002472FCE7|nr:MULTISPECIES: DUF5590 domain-containing protein [unclassified Enterococcus]MDH6364974.1 uncharacterized protein YpmB [Enterococcus sp. PFB1-1]MDH6402075.1 uncharacterized protein YpmB [Enterococcus sp. PF1-24]